VARRVLARVGRRRVSGIIPARNCSPNRQRSQGVSSRSRARPSEISRRFVAVTRPSKRDLKALRRGHAPVQARSQGASSRSCARPSEISRRFVATKPHPTEIPSRASGSRPRVISSLLQFLAGLRPRSGGITSRFGVVRTSIGRHAIPHRPGRGRSGCDGLSVSAALKSRNCFVGGSNGQGKWFRKSGWSEDSEMGPTNSFRSSVLPVHSK
jgi:hypothetical protein